MTCLVNLHRHALAAALLLSSLGCQPPRPAASATNRPPAAHLEPPALRAEDAAPALARLLRSGIATDQQKLELASILQERLTHAEELFAIGQDESATRLTLGCLLLLREGDALTQSLRGRGRALLFAAGEVARQGDSGRALGLYRLAKERIDDQALLNDIVDHEAAILDFERPGREDHPLTSAAAQALRNMQTGAADPRSEAKSAAENAIITWILAARELNLDSAELPPQVQNELAREDYEARMGGGLAMLSLHLRHGDPAGAEAAFDAHGVEAVLTPTAQAKARAASAGEPSAYLDLYRALDSMRRLDQGDPRVPLSLIEGALFWSAARAYERGNGSFEYAMPLGRALVENGQPDVAAIVLSEATDLRTDPEELAWAIELLVQGLTEQSRTDQFEAVERTWHYMQPLVLHASEERFRGLVPTPKTLGRLVANFALQDGKVDKALPLLRASLEERPDAETFRLVAALEHQSGDPAAALSSLERALKAAQAEGNVFLEALAEMDRADLAAEASELDKAAETLGRARSRLLTAYQLDVPTLSKPAILRQLVRVLEWGTDQVAIDAAFQRALTLSESSHDELTATLLDMARSGLFTENVARSREALRLAMEHDLAHEDLLYVALWHELTERRSKTPPTGLGQQALSNCSELDGWGSALRQFALGELNATTLGARARGPLETAEAAFYQALFGDPTKAQDGLRTVARSPAMGLVEVRLARDWLRPRVEANKLGPLALP